MAGMKPSADISRFAHPQDGPISARQTYDGSRGDGAGSTVGGCASQDSLSSALKEKIPNRIDDQ